MSATVRIDRQPPKFRVVLALAAAGALLTFTSLMWRSGASPSDPDHERAEAHAAVDTVPERVAEDFFARFLRQDFEGAMRLCTGRAQAALEARKGRTEDAAPLHPSLTVGLSISEFANLPGGALELLARASGEMSGVPYRRDLTFRLEEVNGQWRVEHMKIAGDAALTDPFAPPGAEAHDPSQFQMRGDDVP